MRGWRRRCIVESHGLHLQARRFRVSGRCLQSWFQSVCLKLLQMTFIPRNAIIAQNSEPACSSTANNTGEQLAKQKITFLSAPHAHTCEKSVSQGFLDLVAWFCYFDSFMFWERLFCGAAYLPGAYALVAEGQSREMWPGWWQL